MQWTNGKYSDENEYKKYIEKNFFTCFFDPPWKPKIGKTKEVNIRKDTSRSVIDYFGYKNKIPTYVEVKNDRIRQRYLLQIVRYYCECNEENPTFKFYVICSRGIRPHREAVLKKLGIKILTEKDMQKELDKWM